jgi:hypothetical protein
VRRLRRILINRSTIPPLLLCMATCVLWVRSYSVQDYAGYDFGRGTFLLCSSSGCIWVGRSLSYVPSHDGGAGSFYWVEEPIPSDLGNNWLLFGMDSDASARGVAFPHWFVALLTIFVVRSIRLVGYIRERKRHTSGHCQKCGYDLRATPDRCPECGATPLAKAIA